MILSFLIRNKEGSTIVVLGLTLNTEEYIEESSNIKKYYNFKYSETITINIVELFRMNKEPSYHTYYNKHDILMDESIITLPDDGLYNINHIVLPTVEWLLSMDDPEYLSEYIGGIYVTDGENIYLSENNSLTIIEPKDFILLDTYKTTISKNSKPTFSIYNLLKCYIRLCNSILQNDYIKCRKDVDSELNFKRDLAWMTINVIKYYIGFGLLYEALRVLERVNYCKGICQDSIISATYIHNNCGCSG